MKDELIQKQRSIRSSFILSSIIFLAALLNISLFLFRTIGADIWVHLTWMRCFSEQFWQGDLYPRWCMDVNNGLGTSIFVFYFPLPFWIAALLHPLVTLGMSYYALFGLICFIASFLAILTCYAWLSDIVEKPYALLASILFVFMPYHLEMVFFRGAYAEIWGFVFLPLIFKYIRRIVRGDDGAIAPLALSVGLCLITHVPITAAALLFGGIYVLVMTYLNTSPCRGEAGRGAEQGNMLKHNAPTTIPAPTPTLLLMGRGTTLLRYALAVIWGAALSVFYLLPAQYYQQFRAMAENFNGLYGWPNSYFHLDLFLRVQGLERPLIAMLLNGLLLAGFAIITLLRRARVADGFIRRETLFWIAGGAIAFFMVFPASAPIYALMGPLASLFFPWRMQVMTITATTYLIAVWMQWMMSEKRKKTWVTDYGLALALLWVLSNFLAASFSAKGEALNEKIREAKIVDTLEYRSIWTDSDRWGYDYLLEQHEKPQPPQAAIVSGTGTAEVTQWGWRGIGLVVHSTQPLRLRINHSYFPVWQATMDNVPLAITPEEHSGLMLVDIPAGEHRILLTYSICAGSLYLMATQWVSVLALVAMAWGWMMRLRFVMPAPFSF